LRTVFGGWRANQCHGAVSGANVAFDDHPNDKRFSDRIETVTVDSVFSWLQRAQMTPTGKTPTVIKL